MAVIRTRRSQLYFLFFLTCFVGWNIYIYSQQSCRTQTANITADYEEQLRKQGSQYRDKSKVDHMRAQQEIEEMQHEIDLLKDALRHANVSIKEQLRENRQKDIIKAKHEDDTVDKLEKGEEVEDDNNPVASVPDKDIVPIIVFAHNRMAYLKRCLDVLFQYHPGNRFPVYVSQDADDTGVVNLVKNYPMKIHMIKSKDDSPFQIKNGENQVYHAIARHYKNGLTSLFSNTKYDRVIILEEDLEIAPDFFSYFTALSHLLDEDNTLFCISAWNDNGIGRNAVDPKMLYRSDFFPGLGWMMKRSLWEELSPKWPQGYWDDWLRNPEQRKGRACIRPEISRTYTFGKEGSSKGQFFESHLKDIKLNKEPVDFSSINVDFLKKENYDRTMDKSLKNSKSITLSEFRDHKYPSNTDIQIHITDIDWTHGRLDKIFEIMVDEKAGIRRTGYRGVVTVRGESKQLVYLVDN